MTKYDEKIINAFAVRLYQRAGAIVFVHVVGLGLLGTVAGRLIQPEIMATAIGLIIGAGIGYYLGDNMALLLRLQAQTALCQAEIERNTRKPTLSPSSENSAPATHRTPSMPGEHTERMAHAIFSNNIEAVKTLIGLGVNVNAPNENGVTPLQMAKNCERTEILDLLAKAGARE